MNTESTKQGKLSLRELIKLKDARERSFWASLVKRLEANKSKETVTNDLSEL